MNKHVVKTVMAGALASLAVAPAAAQFMPPKARAATAGAANIIRTRPQSQAEQQRSWVVAAARHALASVNFLPQQAPETTTDAQAIAAYSPMQPSVAGYGQDWTPDHCENSIRAAEIKYNLPPYILHAIALTESGKDGRPSPVAMNIGGRPFFARSVAEMQQIILRYGERSSIDVGCLQINLKYHAGRFRDWRMLLNPEHNADYAALYLTELYRQTGSWTRAVGAYHSRTPWRSQNYACLVSRKWGQIFGSTRPGCGPNIEAMAQLMYSTAARG